MRWCVEHGVPHSELLKWSPEDRGKLLAYILEDADRCQMCGTSPWEWDEDPFGYEPMVMQCRGCMLKELAKDDQGAEAPGSRITLVPKQAAARIRETKPTKPPRRSR